MDVFNQFLDGKRKAEKDRSHQAARDGVTPATPPEEVLKGLAGLLNRTFYAKAAAKEYLQDQGRLMATLTWPASWLVERGITLPVDRYDAIIREIVAGIVQHGDTAKIKHFPTYFDRCVRLYFVHNGEDLYEERKRMRSAMDLRFLSGMPAKVAPTPDPMEAIAAAHRVLATGRKRAKSSKPDDFQASLFDA